MYEITGWNLQGTGAGRDRPAGAGIGRIFGRRVRFFLPAGLLILGFLAAAARPACAAQVETIDGVPHVRNGEKPESGTETLELEKLWQVGGEDDDALFGVILQVQVDEKGQIYLLDMQLSEVQVYSADGEHLRTLSREGEGPGEARNPSDMMFLPSGNLGLVQAFPGKVIKIDKQGNPAGVMTVGGQDPTKGGFSLIFDGKSRGGKIAFAGMEIAQGEGKQVRTSFLSAFSEESGQETVRYMDKVSELDFSNFQIIERDQYFVYPRRWDLGPDGKVYAAPHRNQYAVHVYASDGTLERVIERKYQSRTRTPEETERINKVIEGQTRQVPFEVKTELEATEPDLTTIRVDDDGSIWVLSSSGSFEQPDGILVTYDVFDPDGTFRKQVAVKCEGNGVSDGLFFVEGDRAILVKGLVDAAMSMQAGGTGAGGDDEEAEPMSVICYKIKG